MGDEDEGDTQRALQFLEFDLHLLPELEVQGTERLVQEEDLGLDHQCPGQGNALPLAAGELGGFAAEELPELDAVQGFPGPLPPLFPGHAAHPQPIGDVVHEGHVREQRVVLKYGVDVPLEGRHGRDVLALEFDTPGRRQLEAGDQAQDRRLAGAGRAKHGEEFPVADVQVHAIYRDGVPEDLGELTQTDRRNLFLSGRGAGGQCFGHGVRLTPLPDRPQEPRNRM
ncbi:hypothetical protein SRABI128_05041 [Microbacterium sp. Bi128]|nr:hypothetical protein SRABI128_05041 [Microbacterium sp. Bi128]